MENDPLISTPLNATDTELTVNATDSEPHVQLNAGLNTTDTE